MKVRDEDTPGVLIANLFVYLTLEGNYANVIVSLFTASCTVAAVETFTVLEQIIGSNKQIEARIAEACGGVRKRMQNSFSNKNGYTRLHLAHF